jgi:transcriptional regulator with XRE-family HTH domain
MLATGCRIGEALAVSWDEVDLAAATVDVCWHLVRVRGAGLQRRPSTKSGVAGERVLPLPTWAVSMLRRRRLATGGKGPVFPSDAGTWRDPANVRRVWREVRADVAPGLVSHQLRKTVATVLDDAGIPDPHRRRPARPRPRVHDPGRLPRPRPRRPGHRRRTGNPVRMTQDPYPYPLTIGPPVADHPVDPALLNEPDMRAALACRDITTVYELLKQAGVSQRGIAALVGQSQSEIWEVLNGRQVLAYDVLVRICEGLGVPRGWMGLAHDEVSSQLATGHQEAIAIEEDEAMKRRNLLASAALIMLGRPVLGAVVLGGAPQGGAATPLPATVSRADVAALHSLTEEFRALGRAGHGVPNVLTAIAARSDQLLELPVEDPVRRKLLSQLADLHTLAGYWCTDSALTDPARYHYSRALALANEAGDVMGMVSAAQHAACGEVYFGDPEAGLKLYQTAQARLLGLPTGVPGVSMQLAALHIRSAYPLALLGQADKASRELERAAEFPPPRDPFERADSDAISARTELAIGINRIEHAERYAATSVRRWAPEDRRDSAHARIALATTHVIAGDKDAPELTTEALDAVGELRSALNRRLLAPLETALAARKDSTSVELARRARALRQPS